ncbi:uncharacterized protein [Takifugu rubripes]|uniref:uncharacterized protein n=1 Tax=Takifugu rubripes TaxID=31033 RepID=UPI001145D34C|nr:uncharacterized protein LOC115251987 [Takifugu rubripes]
MMRLSISQFQNIDKPQDQAVSSHPQDQAVKSQPQDQAINSQPQDQAISNQPQDQAVSSQPEAQNKPVSMEQVRCQKILKLNGFPPKKEPPRKAANVIRMQPGPTRMAVTHTQDIESSFELFIPDSIQEIILDCTNLEGRRVFGERWKEMDQTQLHAYFGVLILAGVFRSKGESAESLWDAETGREIFRATIHPSIHPLPLINWVGSRGQQPKERSPDFPLPSYLLQLIWC